MNNTIKQIFLSYLETVWKTKLIFILFFWIFVAFVSILEPLVFTKIISEIEKYLNTWIFDTNNIFNLIIFWCVFIVFTIIIQYIYDLYLIWVPVTKNYVDICNKYSKIIISMNYPEYLQRKQWSLYKIFDRWANNQFKILAFFFQDILRTTASIIFIIIFMFYINWLMTLITLSMLPIMIIIWVLFVKKVWPYQSELNNKWDEIFWNIWNILSWFMLTKILTLESRYISDIKSTLQNIFSKQIKIQRYWSISNIYTSSLVMISRLLVLWFWIFFVKQWSLSFSELFLFFTYIWWIYFPVGFIFSRLRETTENIIGIEKLHESFDDLEDEKVNEWIKVKNVIWNIEYVNTVFSYSWWKNVLKNLSFQIKSWEKVAFVWNTWAWKSTIINLLLRFWDVNSWEILLDWINIKNISKKSLRNNIWVVSQDVSLFNDSIKNNLLFVNSKATNKDLEKCIKLAEADFVFDFPDWINTIIWERWLKLSWWEKQRLSIARLFLKNPQILILDEATSALDNKTERLIQKALDKLMEWRTTIVIAHRLSTIQNAHKIFVLESWKIVEEWDYQKLIENKWKFFELSNPEHLILN